MSCNDAIIPETHRQQLSQSIPRRLDHRTSASFYEASIQGIRNTGVFVANGVNLDEQIAGKMVIKMLNQGIMVKILWQEIQTMK